MDWQLLLSIIGAAAWLPIVIDWLISRFRNIHYILIDQGIVSNASVTYTKNNLQTVKTGMQIIIALNFFVYNKPFFPEKITCKLKLKNGAVHEAELYEGIITYYDIIHQQHFFNFPIEYDMNINRSIHCNTDNVRVLCFFFEDLNLHSDDNISEIEIVFKEKMQHKNIIFNSLESASKGFISRFDQFYMGGQQ